MSEPGVRVLGQEHPAPAGGIEETPVEAGAPEGRTTGLLARPAVVRVLLVLALAGISGTVAFGLLWAHLQSRQNADAAARSVASRFVYDFTNFDAKSVGTTFDALQGMATGPFATQAKAQFTPQLRKQLEAAQASTRGRIEYLYVQSFTGSRATFYTEVQQTYANDKTTSPQADDLRLVIDLSLVNGQWKVSDVTSLGTASTLGG